MFGLTIIAIAAIYVLLSIGVVSFTASRAKKAEKSPWVWGMVAAIFMYMLLFWDWLPTVASHYYYCSSEAGFWQYKSLEQWKRDNPGVMDTLIDNSPIEYPNWPTADWNGQKVARINQRFGLLSKSHLDSSAGESELFLNNWRWTTELVDMNTGEIMARKIDFSTGNNGYIGGMHSGKFWLYSNRCRSDNKYVEELKSVIKQFRGHSK